MGDMSIPWNAGYCILTPVNLQEDFWLPLQQLEPALTRVSYVLYSYTPHWLLNHTGESQSRTGETCMSNVVETLVQENQREDIRQVIVIHHVAGCLCGIFMFYSTFQIWWIPVLALWHSGRDTWCWVRMDVTHLGSRHYLTLVDCGHT